MSAFTDSVEKVAAALENNSKKFEELDSVAGDGDLGITAGNIAKGLRAGAVGATGDLKADLMLIGREIAKFAPSTFGTLFATGFIRASAAVTDGDALKNTQLAVTAAFEGITSVTPNLTNYRECVNARHATMPANI